MGESQAAHWWVWYGVNWFRTTAKDAAWQATTFRTVALSHIAPQPPAARARTVGVDPNDEEMTLF